MATKRFSTPLRYPGGKGKFSSYIVDIISENDLLDGCYAEPYAGGAGVAFDLLLNEFVSKVYINDVDPAIHAFWQCVVGSTEELCSMISKAPVTIENWKKQREVLLDCSNSSTLELALATFFLNRTNRSGILRAGVIGGVAQDGLWRMDARFNKNELIKRIELIGRFRDRVFVSGEDAIDFLIRINDVLPHKSLVYLDPPYYVKGSELYRNFYSHEDHQKVCDSLDGVKVPWIVSYDNNFEIKKMYSAYRQDEYFLSYTAQDKKRGSEVMIYGPSVRIPHPGSKSRFGSSDS